MGIKFTIIHEESLGDRFRIVSVNRKRVSMLASHLRSMICGYIPKKRIGIELLAVEREGYINVELRCTPYIDSLDMESPVETREELEKCIGLVKLFEDKILEWAHETNE